MQKKTKDMTPEEADGAIKEMMREHHHRMETDPDYREKHEKEEEYWEKLLYPREYEEKQKKD